jgi:metallo-beta-lactamase family protein
MFTMITDYRDTMINDKRPKVVIAASGMVTGGRVLNYLEFISHPETTDYSRLPREGTRGRIT